MKKTPIPVMENRSLIQTIENNSRMEDTLHDVTFKPI